MEIYGSTTHERVKHAGKVSYQWTAGACDERTTVVAFEFLRVAFVTGGDWWSMVNVDDP